jgi:hypothetical protein
LDNGPPKVSLPGLLDLSGPKLHTICLIKAQQDAMIFDDFGRLLVQSETLFKALFLN